MRLWLALALVLLARVGLAEDGVCHTGAPLLSHATLQAMQAAKVKYRRIVASGGWVALPMHSMQPGDRSADVRLLRLRLMREGDLAGTAKLSDVYDGEVAAALKHLQARYGLPETGILDQYTLRTINVPAQVRLAWLRENTGKLEKALAAQAGAERMVTVNIPAAEAEAVAEGEVAGRYRVVAGSAEHPSPEVQARIVAINYSPAWTVPAGIVQHDLVPMMRRDPGYLSRAGFTVWDAHGHKVNPARIDWHGNEPLRYSYRQAPGPSNPMGSVRLNMPNSEDVYMHDTPRQTLFARGIRFFSAGCVRVQDVEKLAAWLRGGTPAPAKKQDVALAQPVPVSWVYMPAWSTPQGVTCFRPDIYGRMDGSDVAAR